MCHKITLFTRLTIPLRRFNIVFNDSFAFSQTNPQKVLSWRVILLGGLAKPLYGLGIIFRHTFTVVMVSANEMLSYDTALIGFGFGCQEFG